MSEPSSKIDRTTILGWAGVTYFVVAVATLHFVDPSLSPVTDAISDYANGAWGWLMVSAFVVIGIGTLFLAFGIHRSLESRGGGTLVLLTSLAGIGFVVAGVFKSDTSFTLEAAIHIVGSLLVFVCLVAGSFALARSSDRIEEMSDSARQARSIAWLLLFTLALFLGSIAAPLGSHLPNLVGLTQRVFVLMMVVWLMFLGLQIRNSALTNHPETLSPKI